MNISSNQLWSGKHVLPMKLNIEIWCHNSRFGLLTDQSTVSAGYRPYQTILYRLSVMFHTLTLALSTEQQPRRVSAWQHRTCHLFTVSNPPPPCLVIPRYCCHHSSLSVIADWTALFSPWQVCSVMVFNSVRRTDTQWHYSSCDDDPVNKSNYLRDESRHLLKLPFLIHSYWSELKGKQRLIRYSLNTCTVVPHVWCHL